MAKHRRRNIAGEDSTKPTPRPYEVDMTDSAGTVYADLYRRCKEATDKGDPLNSVCTTFRMVEDAVKNLIPADPISRRYALTGDLSNIFRIQKGRLRICWIVSSTNRRICILFISETLRKAGDANDPYRVFAKLLLSGEFDELFAQLGVKKPLWTSTIQ